MKKMTYGEFVDAMYKFNEENPDGKSTLKGVIVFTEDSFSAPYTEKERSYRTDNSQKAYNHGMISNSIYADCLNGKDLGVRLDWYMHDEKQPWKVEYCYLETEN